MTRPIVTPCEHNGCSRAAALLCVVVVNGHAVTSYAGDAEDPQWLCREHAATDCPERLTSEINPPVAA